MAGSNSNYNPQDKNNFYFRPPTTKSVSEKQLHKIFSDFKKNNQRHDQRPMQMTNIPAHDRKGQISPTNDASEQTWQQPRKTIKTSKTSKQRCTAEIKINNKFNSLSENELDQDLASDITLNQKKEKNLKIKLPPIFAQYNNIHELVTILNESGLLKNMLSSDISVFNNIKAMQPEK